MDRERREQIREWAQNYLINGGQAGVLELLSDLEAAEEKLRIARECLRGYSLWNDCTGEPARKALEEIGE